MLNSNSCACKVLHPSINWIWRALLVQFRFSKKSFEGTSRNSHRSRLFYNPSLPSRMFPSLSMAALDLDCPWLSQTVIVCPPNPPNPMRTRLWVQIWSALSLQNCSNDEMLCVVLLCVGQSEAFLTSYHMTSQPIRAREEKGATFPKRFRKPWAVFKGTNTKKVCK